MRRGKRYKEEEKLNSKAIMFVLFIFFLCLFIVSGIKIIKYIKNNNDNKKVMQNITKNIEIVKDNDEDNNEDSIESNKEYKIDFKSLKNKNSDTVGFLKVNGTKIEYVVVQSKDNNYYLANNFEKKSNSAGWIFSDYRNKLDGTDKNIIIYGHNMRTDAMFGTLKNILTKEWQENDENRYIVFITENEYSIYEVFSVYQIEAEDYYMTTDFKNNEFKEFVNAMKKRSVFDFGINVNENDKILTLSTCANNSKYRVILHAKYVR